MKCFIESQNFLITAINQIYEVKIFLIDAFTQFFKHSLAENFTQNLILQRSNIPTILQNLIYHYFSRILLKILKK